MFWDLTFAVATHSNRGFCESNPARANSMGIDFFAYRLAASRWGGLSCPSQNGIV